MALTWYGKIVAGLVSLIPNSLYAMRSMSILEETFFKSMVMSFEDYFVMGSTEVLNIIVDPTAFLPFGPGEQTRIPFEPMAAYSNAGPIKIEFFANPTVTPATGTALGASNRDSTSLITPDVVLLKNPTITNDGVRFAGDIVPGNGTGAGNTNGAGNQQGVPFAISNLTKYLIRITNTDGDGVYVETKLTWSEITG